jgi:hypothetical protein
VVKYFIETKFGIIGKPIKLICQTHFGKERYFVVEDVLTIINQGLNIEIILVIGKNKKIGENIIKKGVENIVKNIGRHIQKRSRNIILKIKIK